MAIGRRRDDRLHRQAERQVECRGLALGSRRYGAGTERDVPAGHGGLRPQAAVPRAHLSARTVSAAHNQQGAERKRLNFCRQIFLFQILMCQTN